MLNNLFKSKVTYLILAIYLVICVWWLKINLTTSDITDENYLFGLAYPLIALIGCINGLYIARIWGGFSSLIGKAITLFSIALFGQAFGQVVWSYYNIIARVEIPYPSIGDLGYFSIIPLFILGMLCFAKASKIRVSLQKIHGKALVVVVPLIMLVFSYFLFMKDLVVDAEQPIKTFLDFGYPIGEALTISIAILTYGLSRKILGGNMRGKIMFMIFALILQYLTDSMYLYEVSVGTYYNAGTVDLLYATSFTFMSLGLISFKEIEE